MKNRPKLRIARRLSPYAALACMVCAQIGITGSVTGISANKHHTGAIAFADPMQHGMALHISPRPDQFERSACDQTKVGKLYQAVSTLDTAINLANKAKMSPVSNSNSKSDNAKLATSSASNSNSDKVKAAAGAAKPTNYLAYYHYEKGQLLQALDDLETAEKEYITGWKCGNLDSKNLMHTARALSRLGADKDVLNICTEIINSGDPATIPDAYFARARAHAMVGDDNGAVKDFEASCKAQPDDWHSYFEVGRLYLFTKQPAKAVAATTQALSKMDPKGEQIQRVSALTIRGQAYAKLAKYAEALKDYNEAIGISPLQRELITGRAAIYQSMGDKVRANADMQKAKSLDKSLDF